MHFSTGLEFLASNWVSLRPQRVGNNSGAHLTARSQRGKSHTSQVLTQAQLLQKEWLITVVRKHSAGLAFTSTIRYVILFRNWPLCGPCSFAPEVTIAIFLWYFCSDSLTCFSRRRPEEFASQSHSWLLGGSRSCDPTNTPTQIGLGGSNLSRRGTTFPNSHTGRFMGRLWRTQISRGGRWPSSLLLLHVLEFCLTQKRLTSFLPHPKIK